MGELPSSFDPEATTQKWNGKVDRDRRFSNRDLFEMARDIVWLNQRLYQEVGDKTEFVDIYASHSEGSDFWGTTSLHYITATENNPMEVIELDVSGRRHHSENLSLVRNTHGRDRVSTRWLIPAVDSPLAEALLEKDQGIEFKLTPDQRKTFAHNLWRGHIATAQSIQDERQGIVA